MDGQRITRWRRALAGLLWCAAWGTLLWAIDRPWRDLGGLVHERVRWLQTLVLFVGLLAGHAVGEIARTRAIERSAVHARMLRLILYPLLAAAAAATAVLEALGESDLLLIVVTGTASYWAGLDAGFAAFPLIRGEPYSFLRPIVARARHTSPDPESPGGWLDSWTRM